MSETDFTTLCDLLDTGLWTIQIGVPYGHPATERKALRPQDKNADLPIEPSTTSERLQCGALTPCLDPVLRAIGIIPLPLADPCCNSVRTLVPWKQATGYRARPLGSQAARATAERSIERVPLGEPRLWHQGSCLPPREVAASPHL